MLNKVRPIVFSYRVSWNFVVVVVNLAVFNNNIFIIFLENIFNLEPVPGFH